MCWRTIGLVLLFSAVPAADSAPPEKPGPRTMKEALQPFNDLIGQWRGTGQPEGTRQEQQRGFWTESMDWQWQFKGSDAWLKVAFDKGKYFDQGELRYLPEKNLYQFKLQTPAKETVAFHGRLEDRRLTVERDDEKKQQTQRLVITLLHSNRFLYRYEVKANDRPAFARLYQVGATKEGVPFADEGHKPECVVSGGLGTMKVTHKGQTYYVCCSGCRAAFNDEPEKYIKEYEERKADEKKKGK